MQEPTFAAWLGRYLSTFIPMQLNSWRRYFLEPWLGPWLKDFLTKFLNEYYALPEEGDPFQPSVKFLVEDHDSELTFEGAYIKMNLSTTQTVSFTLKAKNRRGGPADPASLNGSFSIPTLNGASFAVDPANPLKITVTGDSEATVTEEDVAILGWTGTRRNSEGELVDVHGEVAINMVMPGATNVELEASEVTEQV